MSTHNQSSAQEIWFQAADRMEHVVYNADSRSQSNLCYKPNVLKNNCPDNLPLYFSQCVGLQNFQEIFECQTITWPYHMYLGDILKGKGLKIK